MSTVVKIINKYSTYENIDWWSCVTIKNKFIDGESIIHLSEDIIHDLKRLVEIGYMAVDYTKLTCGTQTPNINIKQYGSYKRECYYRFYSTVDRNNRIYDLISIRDVYVIKYNYNNNTICVSLGPDGNMNYLNEIENIFFKDLKCKIDYDFELTEDGSDIKDKNPCYLILKEIIETCL